MKRIAFLCFCFFLTTIGKTALASDLPSDPAIGSGFGVQVKEWRTSSEELDDIKDMGAQYLRFGFEWDVVEKFKGIYDWSAADAFMKKLRNRNFYAVYEIGGTNAAYSPLVDTVPNKLLGQSQELPAAPTTPEALAAMKMFVAETMRRYHGDHVIWEIWNEPDMNSNWPPEVNTDDFAKVISETCATIKQVDPYAIVVGPALAFLPSTNNNGHENFLATILKSPAGACLDAISIHPYRHRAEPPETVMKDYDDLRAYISKNTLPGNKVLPIISSEWGYSLTEVTPEQQAAYALRSLIVNKLSGIPISIWYEWRDSLEDDFLFGDREAHFGLRDYDDGEKLSFTVVNDILPHLLDTRVEKRIAFANDRIYALLLKDGHGQHGLLFWLADRDNRDSVGLEISDRNGNKAYPVGIIPTLVCTDAAPGVTLIPGEVHDEQQYYIPCPQ